MLTVVQVAYPLAPVGPDASGGAEQILTRLDEALVARGHRSIVIACEGSRCRGTLVATPAPPPLLDEAARARAQARHREALARVLATERADLVHLHGIDFHEYLPDRGPPRLVTLHLPLDWYPKAALAARAGVSLVCVSRAQHRARPALAAEVIENGVALPPARARRERGFALFLGRLCPEKGAHLAIDAACAARVPLLVGGPLFPYPAHLDYFARELRPRLGPGARWLGPVGLERKQRLLGSARCLLVPSLAAETSSLVAMEALAAGTPVVALAAGALPEIVEDGVTGIVVRDPADLAQAITRSGAIDPAACRAAAERRFSADRMVARYLDLYRALSAPALRRVG